MLKSIGGLRIEEEGRIKIGKKRLKLPIGFYNDLRISQMGFENYEYVKIGESFKTEINGLYFKAVEGKYCVGCNILFLNDRREITGYKIAVTNDENDIRKSELYFYENSGEIVVEIDGKEFSVFNRRNFIKAVRVFGLKRENMDSELWEIVKRCNKGGVYAVLDRPMHRKWKIVVWDINPMIVEANSEEAIYDEINEILLEEI